jgi:hypothetical protein
LTRAGKEPAEDVKHAICRAIELAGLKVHEVRMYKSAYAARRIVLGSGSPADWPHKLPAVEMHGMVGFDGSIGDIEIRCAATDGDPVMHVFTAPCIQRCTCPLTELPVTLKEVWIARREVIARLQTGDLAPIFDGKWSWELPNISLLPEIG